MSIIDTVKEIGLKDVADMNGLERTQFMNDLFLDYQASKDLRQRKLENFYLELLEQLYWIEYKNEYKKYRGVDTKEERRTIKERIDQIRYKLSLKDKKK